MKETSENKNNNNNNKSYSSQCRTVHLIKKRLISAPVSGYFDFVLTLSRLTLPCEFINLGFVNR